MAEDVVITGAAALGPHGAGLDELRAALEGGETLARPIDAAEFGVPGGACRAGLVPELDWTRWIAPAAARRMSHSSRLLVAAGRCALSDAGLPAPAALAADWSIDAATAFGPAAYAQRLVREFQDGDPRLCSPYLFTDCVANAPAGQLALQLRAGGPNVTHCQREAGPVLALLGACERLRERQAAVALAGTVDELPPLLHGLLDRLRALVRPDADGSERPRPFDARRAGCLAGEGASVLVCERVADAGARGATPRARVRAGGRAFDPSARPHGFGRDPRALADVVRERLWRAGLDPGAVDGVVAGASGTRAGDQLEALVLHEVFGGRVPPVCAPKAVTGEYSGALLPAAVLALAGGLRLPAADFVADGALRVVPHAGAFAPQRVLVTACASGGAFAFVVLERP
jgi:3-oxoacyl-[acyl-carrier-protein] synthase II